MFHKNKQKAIEAAKGEWILQLDADEELSQELKQEIQTIIGRSQLNRSKSVKSGKPIQPIQPTRLIQLLLLIGSLVKTGF